MAYEEKTVQSTPIYNGKILNVRKDEVELWDGSHSFREIVDHPGAVGIVALDADGYVYLVRQFRYAFADTILEIPAGKLDPGEDPLACAVRELKEETGFSADRIRSLGESYSSPGFCQEVLYLYLATGLHSGDSALDEGEFLDVVRLPFDEAVRQVMDNELKDGKTIAALLKTKLLSEQGL